MPHLHWTKDDARLFQLYAVGLHGRNYPSGDDGIRQCFPDLGTLQLDPLPIMGRNHDLVMQSRVDGVRPDQTLDLIHEERLGFEYWDKVYCAIPIERFPLMRAYMNQIGGGKVARKREAALRENHPEALEKVYQAVVDHGPVSSTELKGLGVAQADERGWKSTKAANLALEVLWNHGRVSVSHRVNFRKYFDLTERVIPDIERGEAPPADEALWQRWLVKRVSDMGLLPLKGDAEAWGIIRHARSDGLPQTMVDNDQLSLIEVDGTQSQFLAPENAPARLDEARQIPFDDRARFIAPLDPLLWGRNGVKALWDFEYVWEVYKPAKDRRWGYYVLPVLYRNRFVGRFDGKYDKKTGTLNVLAYHQEPDGLDLEHEAIRAAFERFRQYLGAESIAFPE